MQLIKIEEGLLTGEVLYHDHVVKTEDEKETMRKLVEKKRKQKEQRKKEQAENRARNLKLKKDEKWAAKRAAEGRNDSDPEDDAEYYKEEVGEEPDEGKLADSSNVRSTTDCSLCRTLQNGSKILSQAA